MAQDYKPPTDHKPQLIMALIPILEARMTASSLNPNDMKFGYNYLELYEGLHRVEIPVDNPQTLAYSRRLESCSDLLRALELCECIRNPTRGTQATIHKSSKEGMSILKIIFNLEKDSRLAYSSQCIANVDSFLRGFS